MTKNPIVDAVYKLLDENLTERNAKLKFGKTRLGIELKELTFIGNISNEQSRKKAIIRAKMTWDMADDLLKKKGLQDATN